MKNISVLLFLYLALIAGVVIAQVPQGIPYQAVARDAQGQPLASRAVKVRFSVLDSIATGNAVYTETHATNTSALGLFAVNVGMGTPVTGTFSGINWGVNSKFLKVELDTNASGNNYVDLGTQQMMSVPYALYAGSISSGGTQGQTLTFCDGYPVWTTGGICPGRITELNCSTIVNNGSLASGVSASGVTSVIAYNGGNGGFYSNQFVASTGVAGLTAILDSSNFNIGSGSLTYSIIGTPANSGRAFFSISIAGQNCVFSRMVSGATVSGISSATCGATNVHNPIKAYGSVTDQDGNLYKTIIIGNQEWMAENFKASHYRNGELIPIITDLNVWNQLASGATCWYNNDSALYNCPYGKLYNWYSVVDSRALCPLGWHVPSNLEWTELANYLGGDAGTLKTTGTQYWSRPDTAAINSSGFSGLPGSGRSNGFIPRGSIGTVGVWWSTTTYSTATAFNWVMDPGFFYMGLDYKAGGFSVRCVRD